MEKLKIPRFDNETQEADWWYDHRHEVARDMIAASKAGKLGEGTRARYKRMVSESTQQKADVSNLTR
jgi:hypothetical protein